LTTEAPSRVMDASEYAISVGYEPGVILRDVTLTEARAMECNRCGDCCDTTSEHVLLDRRTGLPRFVWTKPGMDTSFELPEDRYAKRYGRPLIMPVIRGDGELVTANEFERDANGEEHRSFQCRALQATDDPDVKHCELYAHRGDADANRPYHCGAFPVFGLEADQAINIGGMYIPHTAALPRCTWHGIKIIREQSL